MPFNHERTRIHTNSDGHQEAQNAQNRNFPTDSETTADQRASLIPKDQRSEILSLGRSAGQAQDNAPHIYFQGLNGRNSFNRE
jgi:hypothetical protein